MILNIIHLILHAVDSAYCVCFSLWEGISGKLMLLILHDNLEFNEFFCSRFL